MMRVIGISLVGAVMAAQLLFLYAQSSTFVYNKTDYPWMALPVVTNVRSHYHDPDYEDISWTQQGGWVLSGTG